jgi:nucleoside-diphosphate-sugar epimerase
MAALKVLILGINGFIGHRLAELILEQKDWEIEGMDLASDKIKHCLNHPRLRFTEGDITKQHAWLDQQIKNSDVVLPLVAIANPSIYVQDPLRVFELDFMANLDVVRLCVQHKTRVIFPSTSEVYGMCEDSVFDEETSSLVLGPINKPRWIYSCSKQLLDRVIHAHGMKDGLPYTLFRPFNWMGPNLDNVLNPKAGTSRAFTQFLGNILRGENISLVNGGVQRRSFTYLDDGIDALMRIIENANGAANNRIINIGNPNNDVSIRELAELMIEQAKTFPAYRAMAERVQLVSVATEEYYGQGYQDVAARVPSIKNAEKYLGWKPSTDLKTAINKTLQYYVGKV